MKDLIIPIGLPGCGKTTYLKNLTAFKPSTFVSLDWTRQEVSGNMSDLTQDRTKVWPLVRERLEKALKSNAPECQTIVFDATCLSIAARKNFLNIVKEWGQAATLHVQNFTADVQTCIERQKNRVRKLAIPAMYSLNKARTPITEAELPPGITMIKTDIPTEYTLPNANRPVPMTTVKTLKDLEQQSSILGFWKEGAEWCSGRAATLVFDTNRSKKDKDLEAAIKQLVEKGFAQEQALSQKPAKAPRKKTPPRFAGVA